MTGPGITERCTPEQPCPKSSDPSGVSWVDGCWCYRNPAVKVWVVVSDCGLNGPWIHGVTGEEPDKATLDACGVRARRTTGYQFTYSEQLRMGEWR